jgi:hypothetical protein
MRLHDRMTKLEDYEGGWTYVRSATCPCRPCYRPREDGHYNSEGKWVTQIECATRQNSGCPPPSLRLRHVLTEEDLVCERCGARVFAVPEGEPNMGTREEEDGG